MKSAGGSRRLASGSPRKATGSFYTPRALTDFVVRRTLAPLVVHRRADDLLRLRVLDPAMGSGAFLVSACRFLAGAYERALVREGAFRSSDFTARDRPDFRRLVAQRCLYGVDLNPMALQLARLSLLRSGFRKSACGGRVHGIATSFMLRRNSLPTMVSMM